MENTVQWDKYKKQKKIHTYCQHHDPSLQIFCSKVLYFSMGKRVLFVLVVQLPPPRCDTEQPLCCSGQVSFIWKRHLPHSFTFVHAGCHNNVITPVLCFCVEMSFVSSLSYTAHISLKAFSNIPLSITINLCWRINTPAPRCHDLSIFVVNSVIVMALRHCFECYEGKISPTFAMEDWSTIPNSTFQLV